MSLVFEKLKNKALATADWVRNNVYTCAALMAILWGLFFMCVGTSWLVGYWLNGLCGYHFELSSCWQGLLGVIGAVPSIYGLVRQSLGKYRIDSELNSPAGAPPVRR